MLEFNEVELDKVIIHKVGNPTQEEPLVLSEGAFPIEDEVLQDLLKTYFLNAFKGDEFFYLKDVVEKPKKWEPEPEVEDSFVDLPQEDYTAELQHSDGEMEEAEDETVHSSASIPASTEFEDELDAEDSSDANDEDEPQLIDEHQGEESEDDGEDDEEVVVEDSIPEEMQEVAEDEDLEWQNPITAMVQSIFSDQENLFMQSVNIARHLYECSTHPMVKGGELYVIILENVRLDGDLVDAVGIFKSENKDPFLTIYHQGNEIGLQHSKGININKLDKGAIIFNTNDENGYRVCAVDKTAPGSEIANYWKNDFLGLIPREDTYFHTKAYLEMTKGFCEDVFSPENDVSKQDQMVLMNRSINYFQNNDSFNSQDFKEQVIQDAGVIDAFEDYQQEFTEQRDINAYDEFDISESAVKSNQKHFKSVLKLDKKFHVYVHGGHDYMDKGFDEERGMRYYRLFFNKES